MNGNGLEKNMMIDKGLLISELNVNFSAQTLPALDDARADIDVIYRLYDMQTLIRFYNQTYWEMESKLESPVPGKLHLENVAAHTFHVASTVQILSHHFKDLNRLKAIELALVHDQPEVITGDKDPVGSDGQGSDTHAFNNKKRIEKEYEEYAAASLLTGKMRPSLRQFYKNLMDEIVACKTIEARFVKAIDKLQALIFVRLMKSGSISPAHLAFTIRYSRVGLLNYPFLVSHFKLVLKDLLDDIESRNPIAFDEFCWHTNKHLLANKRILDGDNRY